MSSDCPYELIKFLSAWQSSFFIEIPASLVIVIVFLISTISILQMGNPHFSCKILKDNDS